MVEQKTGHRQVCLPSSFLRNLCSGQREQKLRQVIASASTEPFVQTECCMNAKEKGTRLCQLSDLVLLAPCYHHVLGGILGLLSSQDQSLLMGRILTLSQGWEFPH